MPLKAVLESLDLLDAATITGREVADALRAAGAKDVEMTRFTGKEGSTGFVRCVVPGPRGRRAGGDAPTLGIVGRLGASGRGRRRSGSSPTATVR